MPKEIFIPELQNGPLFKATGIIRQDVQRGNVVGEFLDATTVERIGR